MSEFRQGSDESCRVARNILPSPVIAEFSRKRTFLAGSSTPLKYAMTTKIHSDMGQGQSGEYARYVIIGQVRHELEELKHSQVQLLLTQPGSPLELKFDRGNC